MGLDFSPGEAHWSYSGFNEFRRKLAAEINIDLGEMEGFGGPISWDGVRDPIKPLLNHSDCDGELSVSECIVVYPRLLELVKNWDDENYHKEQAKILADDMKHCVKNEKPLRFC